MQILPKVVIGIVLFGTRYLSESLSSLLLVRYPHFLIHLHDQEEGKWSALDFIQKNLPEVTNDPRVRATRGPNRWHSGGQNFLLREAWKFGARYYVAGSNDMLYEADTISNLVAALEQPVHKKFGSATAKLLQWDVKKNLQTNILDSTGICATRAHRFFDRGQGEIDTGQFVTGPVFGGSGALTIYRREALQAIANDGEYFDELLHYKNDVDLAYRLNWAAWPCLFVAEAVAYHARQVSGERSFWATLTARQKISRWVRANSFFGQQVLLAKNFSANFSWLTWLATRGRQLGQLFFSALAEPFVLAQLTKLRTAHSEIERKKSASLHRLTPAELEKLLLE